MAVVVGWCTPVVVVVVAVGDSETVVVVVVAFAENHLDRHLEKAVQSIWSKLFL